MAWIESHTGLIRHHKVEECSAALGIPPVQLVGHLTALWHSVLEQQEDGIITRWGDATIAKYAAWDKDPHEFVSALKDGGWIDEVFPKGKRQEDCDGKMLLIHDWIDYAGRYLTTKYNSSPQRGKLKKLWKAYGKSYGTKTSRTTKTKWLLVVPTEHNPPNIPYLTDQVERVDFPASLLAFSGFVQMFSAWMDYRTEMRKPLKKTGLVTQIKFLAEQPNPIAVIEQSIRNGWQGLFPEKTTNPQNSNGRNYSAIDNGDKSKHDLGAWV